LLKLNEVIKKCINDLKQINTFDPMFSTNLISETCDLYKKFDDIFEQSVNLTDEFINVCEKVK